jgi:hypothetical protein
MFWQRQQTKVLKEFGAHVELYQKAYIISYSPPSQAFRIREEINNRSLQRQYGLIPFPVEEIEWAIATCFKDWLIARGRDSSIAKCCLGRSKANRRLPKADQGSTIGSNIYSSPMSLAIESSTSATAIPKQCGICWLTARLA